MAPNWKKACLAVCVALTGCSSSTRPDPIVYTGRDYVGGPGTVQRDIEDCKAMAGEYDSDRSSYVSTAKSGLVGGAVGAGSGALAGTIMGGNVGRSTGAGAAVGGLAGIVYDLVQRGDSNPSYKTVVQRCLERRGYEVSGWR